MGKFFHIYSSTMSLCSLAKDELESWRAWRCSGCHGPLPNAREIDVKLQDPLELDVPMTGVSGGFPGIVMQELLAQLDSQAIERDLYLGRVFREDGTLVNGWVTFHGAHQLIIRGTKNAAQRRCEECGRLLYFAMGKRYLDSAPPAGTTICESDLSGLILPESEFRRLDVRKWKKGIHIDELRVEDRPSNVRTLSD